MGLTIKEQHVATTASRPSVDPIQALSTAIRDAIGEGVDARPVRLDSAGEATSDSGIDVAVVAPPEWNGAAELQDAIHTRLGNRCDVLAFTPRRFAEPASPGEPVVGAIVRDGVTLLGAVSSAPADADRRAGGIAVHAAGGTDVPTRALCSL